MDSLIQYLTLKERALQCYKKLTANNLPDSYFTALSLSWLVHFRVSEEEYTDEVTRYLEVLKVLEKRQSLSETALSVIGNGTNSRTGHQDEELDADDSHVFKRRRHSMSTSQHRKTDRQKDQTEEVILEEDEPEESPVQKVVDEERAQLHLERTQFLNEKAEDEYQHWEKENEMKKEDDRLKQTRKDLHEMHKVNVRRQAELDE